MFSSAIGVVVKLTQFEEGIKSDGNGQYPRIDRPFSLQSLYAAANHRMPDNLMITDPAETLAPDNTTNEMRMDGDRDGDGDDGDGDCHIQFLQIGHQVNT